MNRPITEDLTQGLIRGVVFGEISGASPAQPPAPTFTFTAPASYAAMSNDNRSNLETVFSTPITLSSEVHLIGDSLTDGYIDGTEYATFVDDIINPTQVINEGISGNRTQDVISRMSSWTPTQLSRNSVLWIGTNNTANTGAEIATDIDTIVSNVTGETLVMSPLYSGATIQATQGIRQYDVWDHIETTYGARALDPQLMYLRVLSESTDQEVLDEINVGDIPTPFTPQGLDPSDPEYIASDGLHVNRIASGEIYHDITRGLIALDGRGALLKDGLTFGATPGDPVGTPVGTIHAVGTVDEWGIGTNIGSKFSIDGGGSILVGTEAWSGTEEVWVRGQESGGAGLRHTVRAIIMERSSVGDLSAPAVTFQRGHTEQWEDLAGSVETGFTFAVCIRAPDSVRRDILNVGRFSANSNGISVNLAARNSSGQSVAAGNIGLSNVTDYFWIIFAYDHSTLTVKSRLNGSNASGAFFSRAENRIDLSGTVRFGDGVFTGDTLAYPGEKDLRCLWFANQYLDPDVHSDAFFNSGTGDPAFTDEALTVNGVTPLIAKLGGTWNWMFQNRGSAGSGRVNPYIISAAQAPFINAD